MRQPADVLGFRDACHELQTELGIPDGKFAWVACGRSGAWG